MYCHKLRPANSGAISVLEFIAVHTAVHHFVRPSRSHYTIPDDVEFTVFAECPDNSEATDRNVIVRLGLRRHLISVRYVGADVM